MSTYTHIQVNMHTRVHALAHAYTHAYAAIVCAYVYTHSLCDTYVQPLGVTFSKA